MLLCIGTRIFGVRVTLLCVGTRFHRAAAALPRINAFSNVPSITPNPFSG
ncbi:MAG: hypothetical protein K2J80_03265 [Oscillospiraceae bacterium]|nr:hypothetical protein [Oscillospiraceae bacterium]